jgi:hypothetical protein
VTQDFDKGVFMVIGVMTAIKTLWMRLGRFSLGLAALMACLSLTGCYKVERYDWIQTTTLEIDTPSGIVTTSADLAVQLKYYPDGLFATTTSYEKEHRGDPLIIDLGEGRLIFGILMGSVLGAGYDDFGHGRKRYQAYTADPPPAPREIDLTRNSKNARYPMYAFMTFTDLNDPESYELVDINDLATRFGPGYGLRRAQVSVRGIEIEQEIGRSPEALTGTIFSILPWLSDHPKYFIMGPEDLTTYWISPSHLWSGRKN